MTDVDTATEMEVSTSTITEIPVTKVKGLFFGIDFNSIPNDVFKEILYLGAKEYINSVGMSKMTGLTKLEGAELAKAQEAVKAQAEKNVEAISTGEGFKFHGTKAETKVSGAIQTEAVRLAKNIVKDWMKANGKKISHTPASEITAAAKLMLGSMPNLYKTAEANLAARAATPIKGIDLSSLIKASPELVKKAEVAKAKKKATGTISAKQAGMVAPKKKPGVSAGATQH